MTPGEIKKVLGEIGGAPNKRLGQNFLIDEKVLADVVAAARIDPGDKVLEIGPGLGVLTKALVARGAEVVAIERDRRFVEYLQRAVSSKIIQGDATEIHWHEIIGNGVWKFVSNLPYAITSFALRKALWNPNPPELLVALVQREVAERATSLASDVAGHRKKGKTSLLSLMVALASEEARVLRLVSADCFYPAPKVESAILFIKPMPLIAREKKWGIDPEKIMQLARRGFAHPRKLLRSNLGLPSTLYHLLSNPNSRAEDLSPEAWACLARELKSF
ncbi:MAG: 16S rRNA (adenine(1518)-N(6)/adenine(1519)-N(6))-dimethyltransferase RsmA [Patescibacteria group bacterium]